MGEVSKAMGRAPRGFQHISHKPSATPLRATLAPHLKRMIQSLLFGLRLPPCLISSEISDWPFHCLFCSPFLLPLLPGLTAGRGLGFWGVDSARSSALTVRLREGAYSAWPQHGQTWCSDPRGPAQLPQAWLRGLGRLRVSAALLGGPSLFPVASWALRPQPQHRGSL